VFGAPSGFLVGSGAGSGVAPTLGTIVDPRGVAGPGDVVGGISIVLVVVVAVYWWRGYILLDFGGWGFGGGFD